MIQVFEKASSQAESTNSKSPGLRTNFGLSEVKKEIFSVITLQNQSFRLDLPIHKVPSFCHPFLKSKIPWDFLAVHWYKLHTSTAGDKIQPLIWQLRSPYTVGHSPSKRQDSFCKSSLYHVLSICCIPQIVIKMYAYYLTESSES